MNRRFTIVIEESNLKFKLYYTRNSIKNCFIKIAKLTYNKYKESQIDGLKRYIIAIAGPPGCGKSSISHLFSYILKKEFRINSKIIPLDGFHYDNNFLKSHNYTKNGRIINLYDIKGAPETYNTNAFKDSIKKLIDGKKFYWPIYSRKIHNPVENGIEIVETDSIFIIEGNYLFLDESPWKELIPFYNLKIFIKSKEKFLRRRVIKRKIAGGYKKSEALKHYKISDKENIKRVLKNIAEFDILIKQRGRYSYSFKKR